MSNPALGGHLSIEFVLVLIKRIEQGLQKLSNRCVELNSAGKWPSSSKIGLFGFGWDMAGVANSVPRGTPFCKLQFQLSSKTSYSEHLF